MWPTFTLSIQRILLCFPIGGFSCLAYTRYLSCIVISTVGRLFKRIFLGGGRGRLKASAHSDMNVVTILVGNKSDLKDIREVPTAEGKALAEAQGLFFMETSALDSSNVAAAFETVVKEIYNILSRKVMSSQELNKQDPASLSNGKKVVIPSEGESKTACSNSTEEQHHRHRKWVGPSGHKVITVSLNGHAQFRSVQDAVDSVPKNNNMSIVIKIAPGYYREKVVVPATKPYITFKGAGRDVTVIEWHDRASDRGPDGQQLRTYQTASVTVYANHFSARNISFTNTAPAPMPGMQGWQAVAFRISGDKAYFSGCGFYGAQDTLCDDAGRHYFKECYIEGSIDFIFGNGRSMYKDCELHSIASRFGSIAAHGRTCPEEKTGFTFVGCRVTGTGPLYVGRAMGQYSRIVYAYTYFDALVAHGGWDDWDHKSNKSKTAFFGVYNCYGPGAAATTGVSWARALDYESAHPFIAKSFVNGRHWIAPRDA